MLQKDSHSNSVFRSVILTLLKLLYVCFVSWNIYTLFYEPLRSRHGLLRKSDSTNRCGTWTGSRFIYFLLSLQPHWRVIKAIEVEYLIEGWCTCTLCGRFTTGQWTPIVVDVLLSPAQSAAGCVASQWGTGRNKKQPIFQALSREGVHFSDELASYTVALFRIHVTYSVRRPLKGSEWRGKMRAVPTRVDFIR